MSRNPFCLQTASLAFLACWFLCIPAAHAEDSLTQGERLFQAGAFADAEAAYAETLRDDPRCAAAALRLGKIALLSNRLDAAEKFLKNALELEADNRKAQGLLAETYHRLDRFDEAAPLYRACDRAALADMYESFEGKKPYDLSASANYTELEFVKTDPLPIVKARINGVRDVFLLIDTGASELSIDRELAEELGVKCLGETTATFAGGRQASVGHACIDSLQLGEFDIRNLPVSLMPLNKMSLPGMPKFEGIIGTVVFYHFITTLDYPAGKLKLRRITPAALAELDEKAKSADPPPIPFWMAGDHFMVAWGRANQADPCLMLVDTGMAGGGFGCPESTLKAAGIELPEFSGEGIGGGGMVKITPITVRELSLGNYQQKNIRGFYGVFPKISENGWGFPVGGIVSHLFFRPCAVTFDFTKMRLFLETPR